MNGAATNPDAHVFACAGAAVRKGLEVAHKLGAENFVFWGGREGFQTLLNTDLNKEMQHMANFFRMAVGENPGDMRCRAGRYVGKAVRTCVRHI